MTNEKNIRPSWVDNSLFPFKSNFMELDGCNIHYVDVGSGPTLLLLHGNPTWSFLYRNIIKALSPRFRCVAPDYPGFGLSSARNGYGFTPSEHSAILEKFTDKLGLSDVTMMVQDWGGPIGMGLAVRRPEMFRAFVIGNTWAWPVNGDAHFEQFSKFMGGMVGRFLIRRLNFFVGVILVKNAMPHNFTLEEIAMYRGPFPTPKSRDPLAIFPKQILEARAYLAEVEKGLSSLSSRPALLVWGDKDVAFREKELNRWQSIFPAAKTVMLTGAGHYIQEAVPERITDAITEWWR
ncbi:MAG: alpha/beta fold hydrolase [Nitrospinae bacterium]|nr:alpha/beta fold hydrolase [Nitrospinota bacterium]